MCAIAVTYKLFTISAQSSGPENFCTERPLPDLLAPRSVLSRSRITLENNEKIRPQPDRENAFAGASGGADATSKDQTSSAELFGVGFDLFAFAALP